MNVSNTPLLHPSFGSNCGQLLLHIFVIPLSSSINTPDHLTQFSIFFYQDARILGTNVGPVRMEQQLEVAVMEPNVDHGHPIMNLGMEVLPGIAFPCQGSHQEEPATM